MTPTLASLLPAAALLAPALLLLVGLMPAALAERRPRLAARLNEAAAWLALAVAVAVAIGHGAGAAQVWTAASLPLPGGIGAFTVGTYVNGVTVVMLLLVSFVGAIVSRFSRNYLDGEARQGFFHRWLALTLAAILLLIVSGNLLLFGLAWVATSLCLHRLLTFYAERRAALLAAHKKFVASRIGDASLLLALYLIGSQLHTLEFHEIAARMAAHEGPLPAALGLAALLIVISAALKSAQFPLHGWLIQVMEAPTPVSALLHAGIVNAGAFLILRMSPVMSHAGGALTLLALIGLLTLTLASLVMLTQTSIKVSLAWSTTAQMGFMLLECGLGLYGLALLHLVAHSLYKAHAFLASGSGVDGFRAPLVRPQSPSTARRLLLALAAGAAMTAAVAALFGLGAASAPAMLAAAAVVAVATGALIQHTVSVMGPAHWPRALGLGLGVVLAYFTLHAAFDALVAGSVLPLQAHGASGQALVAPLVVAAFLGLLWAQHALRAGAPTPRGRLYVHLYNGLYIDVYITRLLQRLWPAPARAA